MHIKGITVVTFLMISFAAPGHAADYSGNWLKAACASTNVPDKMMCLGYVGGALDTSGSFVGGTLLCLPDGTTRGQAVSVVDKYMRDHPEELHMPASNLIVKAVLLAWPCAKK
jgi:hypothetical protein